MKIETPEEFKDWILDYSETANYFMATRTDSKDENHAVWLCMRDAFIAGLKSGSQPVKEEK